MKGKGWLKCLVRWCRDVRSVRECKSILRANLDRNYDDDDSLRTLTVVAVNALFWERQPNTSIGPAQAANPNTCEATGSAVCSECGRTNVNLLNLGAPSKPRMVCHGCCKRTLEAVDACRDALRPNAEHDTRHEAIAK
jgi:hypothetical protein